MVTDTISDMLTRIRNATMVKHQIVQIPVTKMSLSIASILKDEGFIEDFEIYTESPCNYLLISLKYKGKQRKPVISKIERISKPGLRVYTSAKKLPKVLPRLVKLSPHLICQDVIKLLPSVKILRFKQSKPASFSQSFFQAADFQLVATFVAEFCSIDIFKLAFRALLMGSQSLTFAMLLWMVRG